MKKITGIFATQPFLMFVALLLVSSPSFAQETSPEMLNLTTHWVGYISLVLFAGLIYLP
jgi:succinate dehydrogenase/fumarate reductase cytochrome b subunit